MTLREKPYSEVREQAMRSDASADDRLALFFWCELNGVNWNGEYYDIDDGHRIYLVYNDFPKPKIAMAICSSSMRKSNEKSEA